MSRYYRSFLEESGTVYTARTTAFASATSITDTTILNALNTFDLGLISNGLDTKMKALYPFVGGTSTTHKYNFMNAVDSDAAFRLQFNGGWTHSNTGAKPSGTNGYANTFLIPATTLTTMSQHISYYSQNNISTTGIIDFGLQDDKATGASGSLYGSYYANSSQSNVNIQSSDANRIFFTETNSLGFLMGSRTSSTSVGAYRNNLLKGTNTATSTQGIGNIPVFLGALNYRNGSGVYTTYYGIREVSFSSIGTGLSDTDASNLYNLVQAMQTSLSRQV